MRAYKFNMNLKDIPLEMEMDMVMEVSDEELVDDDIEIIEIPETEFDQSDTDEDEEAGPARDDASLVFSKHEGSVYSVDMQPGSGSLAVSGAQDNMAYVWDVNSGEVLLNCLGHQDSVVSVGFNHDGTYVATGDLAGYLQVWKLSTKSQIWRDYIGDTSWLRWHPRANVVLAAAKAGEVYIWKVPTGDCIVLPGHCIRSECGHVLPDGRQLAVGYDDGSLNLFDMKSSKLLHKVPPYGGLPEAIVSMDSFDNSLVLYGTEGISAHLMKTQTGKIVSSFRCSNTPAGVADGIEALGFCKDPSIPWAATGSLSGKLTIWDISREAKRHEVQLGEGIIKLLWLKSDVLITGDMDGIVRLYDGRSGKIEREFHGHSRTTLDLVMSTNNYKILSASDDNTVRVFDCEPPEEDKSYM